MNIIKLLILILFLLVGCSEAKDIKNVESSFSLSDNTSAMTEDEREAVVEILQEAGVDSELLEDVNRLDSGGTVLGAKPVKQFRTLHDAETAYGCYFGFHNTIQAVPEYSLVGMYSVNGEYLQGMYETADMEHTFNVKFSREQDSNELRSVYDTFSIVNTKEYKGVQFTSEGDTEGTVNLILIDFPNNKGYTIFSHEGFEDSTASLIAEELIDNVQSMGDWEQ